MSVVVIVSGRWGRGGQVWGGYTQRHFIDRQFSPVCPVSEFGVGDKEAVDFVSSLRGLLHPLSCSTVAAFPEPRRGPLQSSLDGTLESSIHPVFYWPRKCRARLKGRDLDPPLNKRNRKRTRHYTLCLCTCVCICMCVCLCVYLCMYIFECMYVCLLLNTVLPSSLGKFHLYHSFHWVGLSLSLPSIDCKLNTVGIGAWPQWLVLGPA